jgi:NAD+ diphosphatase
VLTQRESSDARFLVMSGMRCLTDGSPAAIRISSERLPAGWRDWQSVFLGVVNDAPVFALAAPDDSSDHFQCHGAFAELRGMATALPPADAGLIVHARAVLHWHALNQYCGACGRKLACSAAGHARRCLHDDCAVQEFYPRIDPAVIVLVTHGDHCLLGRQAGWPEKRYSCLAGFMEAGETLEETVRREVHEEAGVVIDDIVYHSSQPWPFPQSLMVGFEARAVSRDAVPLPTAISSTAGPPRTSVITTPASSR